MQPRTRRRSGSNVSFFEIVRAFTGAPMLGFERSRESSTVPNVPGRVLVGFVRAFFENWFVRVAGESGLGFRRARQRFDGAVFARTRALGFVRAELPAICAAAGARLVGDDVT